MTNNYVLQCADPFHFFVDVSGRAVWCKDRSHGVECDGALDGAISAVIVLTIVLLSAEWIVSVWDCHRQSSIDPVGNGEKHFN